MKPLNNPMRLEFYFPTALELEKDHSWWHIYEEAFPPIEREPQEVILKTISENLGLAIQASINGQTVGIATIHLLRNCSTVFLVYLAVSSSLRSNGVGGQLLEQAWLVGKEKLAQEGIIAQGLVWESSSFDSALTEKEKEDHKKRENFYYRQGGQTLLDHYIQPPVDGKTLVTMKLFYRPNSLEKQLLDKNIANHLVRSIYWEKYHKANGINEKTLKELEKLFL